MMIVKPLFFASLGFILFAATVTRAAGPVGGKSSTVTPPESLVRSQVPQRAFDLVSVWFSDPVSGKPRKATKVAGKWVLPLTDLKLYPPRVFLTWKPHDFPESQLPALLEGNHYFFELDLDSKTLKRGPDGVGDYYWGLTGGNDLFGCPPGKQCLYTTIAGTRFFGEYPPWIIEIRLAKAKRLQIVKPTAPRFFPCPYNPARNCATPPETLSFEPDFVASAQIERIKANSYFESALYPTFQHPRCATCHSLGSADALIVQHKEYGGYVAPIPKSTGHGTVFTCTGSCHHVESAVPGTNFTEIEWKTPGFDMGIQLQGKSPKEICNKVKMMLKTASAMKTHFHEDARIGWAVHSGEVPFDGKKPVAPPGSYADWVIITNKWIDGGAPCPP